MSSGGLVVLAELIGWAYLISWILSLLAQVYETWKRQSAVGLSFDMVALFFTGCVTYLVYNGVVYFCRGVQEEILRSSSQASPVSLPDFFFALTSFLITCVQIVQILIYERGGQSVHQSSIVLISTASGSLLLLCFLAAGRVISWILVLQFSGYIKTAFSLFKYSPQVWLNYKRKCTEGFAIGGVLLDFSGGVLSILQQDIYCVIEHSNKQLTGNIPKLALGGVTLFFNIILIWQHYVFYFGNVPPELQKKTILISDDEKANSFELNVNERKPLLA